MATGALIGLAAVSTGLAIHGQMKDAKAKQQQLEVNEEFFREQADQSLKAGARSEALLKRRGRQVSADQVSAFGAAGIDISGSALMKLAETEGKIFAETRAIRTQAIRGHSLAMLRASGASAQARDVRNALPLQIGSSLLTGATQGFSFARTARGTEPRTKL